MRNTTLLPFSLLLAAALVLPGQLPAADTGTLDAPLEPLRPFIGKTWRGEFKESKPDKPMIDVSRWERALNGKAIKIIHSVNDGAYGGESFLRWDREKQELVFHYFTTAGFHTTGTATVTNGKIVTTEKVRGHADGITEVRATLELRPDGTLLSRAEYLKNGEPAGGREVIYKEDPKAEVKFK